MHRTATIAAPVIAVLLAATACSSNGAAPGPAPSDSLNACQFEDAAYRQAGSVIQGGTYTAGAASTVDAYVVQLDVAETYVTEGSALFKALSADLKDAYALENELIIENASGITQEAKATEKARQTVVADCQALGYPYSTAS